MFSYILSSVTNIMEAVGVIVLQRVKSPLSTVKPSLPSPKRLFCVFGEVLATLLSLKYAVIETFIVNN